jgi:hypothetical protein
LPAVGDVVFYVTPIDGRPVVVEFRVRRVFLEPAPGRFGLKVPEWRTFGVAATRAAVEWRSATSTSRERTPTRRACVSARAADGSAGDVGRLDGPGSARRPARARVFFGAGVGDIPRAPRPAGDDEDDAPRRGQAQRSARASRDGRHAKRDEHRPLGRTWTERRPR